MKEHHTKAMKDLIREIDCPRSFRCVESGFEVFGKVMDPGLDGFLECLDDFAPSCTFAMSFGGVYFCCCPVRVYAGMNLGQ